MKLYNIDENDEYLFLIFKSNAGEYCISKKLKSAINLDSYNRKELLDFEHKDAMEMFFELMDIQNMHTLYSYKNLHMLDELYDYVNATIIFRRTVGNF